MATQSTGLPAVMQPAVRQAVQGQVYTGTRELLMLPVEIIVTIIGIAGITVDKAMPNRSVLRTA